MAESFKTQISVEVDNGRVVLTTRDEDGELVAQIHFTPEQAIHQASRLLSAGFAAKGER